MNVVIFRVLIVPHLLRNRQASGRQEASACSVPALGQAAQQRVLWKSQPAQKSEVLPSLAPPPGTQGRGRCLSVRQTVAVSESQFCTVCFPNAVKFKKSYFF